MPRFTITPQPLEARLGRYTAAAAAACAAAAAPAQAAPITVLLPTPVDVRNGYQLDFDQNGSTEMFFSGSGSTFYACYFGTADVFLNSVGAIRQLSEGVAFGLTAPDSLWGASGTLGVPGTTSADYFIGIRFASSPGPANRAGFAQMNGSFLYGFAWQEAEGITTFDLRQSSSAVPEPATGALAALALGALAVAARKRKPA